MNFTRGMQRLALFAGVLGALAGGIYAYKILRKVPSERFQHKVFESLAESNVVKQARTKLQVTKIDGVPEGASVEPIEGESFSEVDSDRIKVIFWNHDWSVRFFLMQDGGYVLSGPAPSIWLYLLWFVFPIIGFAILWGTIRGLGWVVDGFFSAMK
jgi:hypothetical protein